MRHRRLRKKCTALIRSLDLPDPFDIEVLCTRIGDSRGRPLQLAPLAFPAEGPCGLLVSTAAADYIFYEANTGPTHRTHVIAHELGHLLLDHHPAGGPLDDCAGRLVPDGLDSTLVQHMFGRNQYAHPDEFAAEYFATRVLRQVSDWNSAPPSVPPGLADLVHRLERSLHHRNQ